MTKAPETLFKPATKDLGAIEGLGKVTLREATIGDLWPYMGGDMQGSEFPLRVLAASLLINEQPVSYEQLLGMGMRHLTKLQVLLPEVMEINGLNTAGGEPDEDDEGDEGENPPVAA